MTTHGSTVTTTTQQQPYQGYPYVNPVVNDVPSIEPSSSYRNNQPRRLAPTINPQTEVTKDNRNNENPVIYINIPETSTSEDSSNTKNEASIDDDDLPPVIYIDLPQSSHQMTESQPKSTTNEGTSIYDTIYFHQFEDSRQITRIDTDESPSLARAEPETRPGPQPISQETYVNGRLPTPDNGLCRQITRKDTASNTSDENPSLARAEPETRPATLPISQETYVYGRLPTPDDGFNLSPIPISEFPEPPPAYSEFQQRGPVTQQPTVSYVDNAIQNPRTVIITNDSASQRKLVTCQHCGTRVYTMVLKQVGAATHALALSFMLFCLLPLTILVYCCNWFKYENHYCPTCSKLIGFEVPMLCQSLVYVTTD